jgi:glycerol-3-phosphate dehydrogenase
MVSPITAGHLNRSTLIERVESLREPWDVVVIGGGATGLGTALDAAVRGYRTLLLERHDFGKGASTKSTKLAHGGVRYLRQGNISLVFKALRERGLMLRNAPHLVHRLRFVIPCYGLPELAFYGAGLKLYDLLALRQSLGRSTLLSKQEVIQALPGLRREGLRGGVAYYDGQFHDARYAVNLAQSCAREGAVPLNYFGVVGLIKNGNKTAGVLAHDYQANRDFHIEARSVVNATGVFVDAIRSMDDPSQREVIQASQGVHLVLDRSFLGGDHAIMVPKTDDGRVLFAIPWRDRVLLGTTDSSVDSMDMEPRPLEAEISYLLDHASRYLRPSPRRSDIKSAFAGLRPLVGANHRDTKIISRDHSILISDSGLVTITGGKWTTYRQMAEDAVDQAARVASLQKRPSTTRGLRIHGWVENPGSNARLAEYGADRMGLMDLIEAIPDGRKPIHPRLPYARGQVVWSVRHEMALTLEDVLARRTRALFLDAAASVEAAPLVASLMASELHRDAAWEAEQVKQFTDLASDYIVAPKTLETA